MAEPIIAKYIRLSLDDAQTDSMSLGHQRLLLDQYIADSDLDGPVREFVDNGFSGLNFERPAVQELLELVKDGSVGCILVKDFSRFGRNAIETGYFIERVFPLYRVRFISVSDHFDSAQHDGDTGGMEVAFKFLMSEYYSHDLSRKISSAKREKARRGEAVTKNCAFGYRLDENRKMVIDEDAAVTVRIIFGMYAEGKSLSAIEGRLYEENRPTPAAWKKHRRQTAEAEEYRCVWQKSVIRSILHDEQYIGIYTAGKTRTVEVGNHNRAKNAKEDWIRIPDHHPAIISQELFDAVQEQLLTKGEPALCTDTKEVFVGNSGGNVALINKEVMDDHLKNYTLQVPYATAAGSANAYTATLNPSLTAYTEGVAIAVKINAANTGASTININSLGAKSIRDPRGNTLPAGKLTAGSIYTLRYNGTNFILQGEGASGNATASDLLSGKTASTDAGDITGTMLNRTGHVTAQSSSVSGTTLRLRPQSGYYDGSSANSVQYTDSNFIATNIRSGVSIFGVTGTMPVKPDDYRGSPGGQFLTHGYIASGGYLGRYTGIVSGNSLASACGVTIGTSQIYLNNSIDWVKFGYEGKILFIAFKPIRRALSWDDLNAKGCVFGEKQVTFDGITYKSRLMRIRNGDPGTIFGGDLNLLSMVRQSSWDNLTDDDLYLNQGIDINGRYSLAQETIEGSPQNCQSFTGIGAYPMITKNVREAIIGWRPVLEVI